jgi:hypothetical protein
MSIITSLVHVLRNLQSTAFPNKSQHLMHRYTCLQHAFTFKHEWIWWTTVSFGWCVTAHRSSNNAVNLTVNAVPSSQVYEEFETTMLIPTVQSRDPRFISRNPYHSSTTTTISIVHITDYNTQTSVRIYLSRKGTMAYCRRLGNPSSIILPLNHDRVFKNSQWWCGFCRFTQCTTWYKPATQDSEGCGLQTD